MKYVAMLLFGTIGMSSALAAASLDRPLLPAARPVSEVLFGTTVTDPYRYFEAQDAAVTDWMKAEGRYTRSLIDSRPGRAETLKRISQITGSFDVVNQIQSAGGRTFYQQRSVGSDNFDLMVRNRDGSTRKLVDVGAIRAAHGGTPIAINYYQPSNDGTKAAVGISEGGSEDASLYVYDTSNGVQIAEPVPKAEFGAISWAPDDQSLFVVLLNVLKSGEPEINKYKNAKVHVWDLKSKPVPVLGAGITPAVQFTPEEIPVVATFSGSPIAMALNINGVQNEWEIWTAPVSSAERADAPWKKLASRDAGVTSVAVAGDRIFLLSHKGSPTFQVLRLKAGEPLAAAKVVVAARPDRLIESVSAAADGLYVRARRGVYSELFKVPLDGGPEQQIALPVKGSITELSADPRSPGATVIVGSWAVPQTALTYDPAQQKFANLGLGNPPKGFDPALFAVSDLMVKAKDGVEVPLSFVSATASKHPRPVLLWAYGSYGSSQYPGFGTRVIATLTNGIDYAVCHVRGGGELGEAWRLAGKDANKPNTWRDLIACGEDLIARGYTTKGMLFIGGGSAGGITVGRAMQERPDLFAGVLDLVPAANTVRSEFTPNGPPNIPEFGTIKTEQGFKNLHAMDSILNVKPGVHYPAIMITTGLNDPRVASWEPAKLAATMLSAGATAPVLLRIDEKAGHGIGSTKAQTDELWADIVTFIQWQSANPSKISAAR